ncbi:MAG TPA: hypothetical protein VGQ09_01835 [Chitinophagaceae bacterium]|jgi:hypothetical protein|nr:hypothetical protein [Chitinophagaceae bacterium]
MEEIRTIYRQLLRSDGIDQLQRLLSGLQQDYVQLEDRGAAQRIDVLYQLSKQLRFFNADLTSSSDWSSFFKRFENSLPPSSPLPNYEEIENDIANSKNFGPAQALLIVFLKLLEHTKANLNKMTRRHLEFYYKDVLGFKLRSGEADKVHVLFELAKNAAPQLINSGILLNAGKIKDGKELNYKTTSDMVVNQAKIAAISSLFVEKFTADRTLQLWSSIHDPQQMPETILPFGGPQSKLPLSGRSMQYSVTGMAISSSLLELAGGERRITITITSEAFTDPAPAFVDLRSYIQIELTGEKGWIAPLVEKAFIQRKGTGVDEKIGIITIQLLLSEALPEISGYNGQIHKSGFADGTPVFRMSTIPERRIPDFFQTFRIAMASMKVVVKGLKKLIVQNEEGLQVANKPFNAFSSLPAIGDHLYIGSEECFHKNLKQLSLNIQWKSPPADFKKYYAGYRLPSTFSHADFGASLNILLNGTWDDHPLVDRFFLFDAQHKDYPLTLTIDENALKKANGFLDLQRAPGLPDLSDGFQPGISRGFIRLTLTGPEYENFSAFGHNNYASALTAATLDMVRFPDAGIELPSPPYTPQVKEISLDYQAADIIFPSSNDVLYHQMPFGTRLLKGKGASLFPAFSNTGYLYIGIADLQPEQQVNLLFSLAEQSSVEFEGYESDFSTPVISWSYLSNDDWIELRQDQIPTDTTKQFQQSGIISVFTGADANITNLSMPSGMMWLQASLEQGLNRVLPLSSIHTQAIEAILDILPEQRLEDFAEHLSIGLPPDQIKKNIQISPSLKSISQPYASFGGVQPETTDHFIIRLSERLRHRKRAIHPWDFERLGLEAFPSITKIKCLAGDELSVPGTASVVVIPQINRNHPLAKRLQPKASSFFLDQVRQFLTDHTSFFTTVLVSNPDYEEILTDFKVKFKIGFDPVFYLGKLNEDIVRFLSPWAFSEKTALHFDSEIYRSEIMYFIEKLSYVDYIADFKLFHLSKRGVYSAEVIGKMKIGKNFIVHKPLVPNIGGMKIGESFIVGIDWEVVTPTQNTAILVSVPQHTIKVVDDQRICSGISGLGIGSMTISLDFVVSKS